MREGPTDDYVGLGAAAGKYRSPPGAFLGVGGAALHSVGGVGHREYDGPLVEFPHSRQNLLGEDRSRPRQSDQGSRFHLVTPPTQISQSP
jgi:hypothetical protein